MTSDVLAGAWGFAGFMLACAAYGAVDVIVEPAPLSALFLASQVPFAAGAVLLALASCDCDCECECEHNTNANTDTDRNTNTTKNVNANADTDIDKYANE